MIRQYTGPGNIQQLHSIIKKLDAKRILIVSGKQSYELSGAKEKLKDILDVTENLRYFDFEENPKFRDALKGKKIIKDFNPDLIVAIGGGSVMDIAKLLSILPDEEVEAEKMIRGEIKVTDKLAPMIAIPTTSGSGSEATHFAVVYINDVKYSLAADLLIPEYVILDPELTYSVSSYQTAVSGMDALCQGIESYWAKDATDESRSYASEAIPLIFKSIEKAVNSPDPESRLAMSKGSNLAGKAINISKTTAPHALSYAFTTYHGIPHGHAVALTLGEFFVFKSEKAFESSDNELKVRMAELFELFGCENAFSSRNRFRQIMASIGLNTTLSEMTNTKVDIHQLADTVNSERLANHPVIVSKQNIRRITTKICSAGNFADAYNQFD
jgi:alcohol dehydrogenase class IV